MWRAELRHRVRNDGESLCDLAQDVTRLVRKVYEIDPKPSRDRIATDVFIDALDDAEMEWSVRQHRPATVDQALLLAA
jgi:hypothetical protein